MALLAPHAVSFDLYYCQVDKRVAFYRDRVEEGLSGWPSMFRIEIFRDKGLVSIEGSYFNGGVIRDPI